MKKVGKKVQNKNNNMANGLFWKLMERFGVQGTRFLLSLYLARILAPEHYGASSMMVIFTSLATVFIEGGLNTSLIQNKDVTEEDYSSIFWVSLTVAAILYSIIFLATPAIAAFYRMPEIIWPLRVLALMLLPGALNSVQLAKISRKMDFKKHLILQSNGYTDIMKSYSVCSLAAKALAAIDSGKKPYEVTYRELPDRTQGMDKVFEEYRKYVDLLERYFPDHAKCRDIDRALWVYGHMKGICKEETK